MPTTKRTRKKPPGPNTKIQRWIDLLAALLARQMPATLEELRRDVPAYAANKGAALGRMFERDKDELRAFGVPIESLAFGDPPQIGYRLRSGNFYLPFVAIATSAPSARQALPPAGYRALEHLAFEPDELRAVSEAAARVRALGEPLLAGDAESAMRKLAFDVPPDAIRAGEDEHIVADPVDAKTFASLGAAVLDHKTVAFDYHSMSTDETKRREVEPYGLIFLGAHWYLVGRDTSHGRLRNFRLSRMAGVTPNRSRPQTPDYAVPSAFRLDDHARSRDAWTLGDEAVVEAIVEFSGTSGAAKAAAKLGRAVRGSPQQRRFEVRRPDTFARCVLAFGGDATPVQPAALIERFNSLARETLERYGERR